MGLAEKTVVSEARLDGSQESLEVKSKSSWKGYLWDTWTLPQEERRLLFKLDAFVLTFASIGYFLKNLDQSNVNNAFLSGMKEDLQMYGNELVTSTSIYTVGYVIGQVPSNLLLTRVSPRWVIPMLECRWGVATICTAAVKSYRSLYALRFLVGLFESGFYPALCYVVWNNGWLQPATGQYWLKSFNETPAPVPGTSFSVADINDLPLPTTGIFIVMALIWGWASDGPCHGVRWPFIYIGAVITLLFSILLRQMSLYGNINGRMVVYWMSQIGNGAGPLILTWINEICSDDTEKRALLVALGNDLAYVVQAVAPNFVWKTTDFPAARKGYLWCIVMQVLLGLFAS
ncbi:hypothetical protein Daus18300_003692 [Diaporthe australafricana]|uniref:Allantoate permease n=1 Tax=Diaporthe australafricana TaxID=127596 RepID=A0ABR3XED9_9PEZI